MLHTTLLTIKLDFFSSNKYTILLLPSLFQKDADINALPRSLYCNLSVRLLKESRPKEPDQVLLLWNLNGQDMQHDALALNIFNQFF